MARLTTDPLIGMTVPARATSPEQQRSVERKTAVYRRALEAHGARVVEISPESREICLDKLQALLLTGGGDVDPSYYGQRPHPKLPAPCQYSSGPTVAARLLVYLTRTKW